MAKPRFLVSKNHPTVKEFHYMEKFEVLKSLMTVMNTNLPESYYVSSFVSGIKDDVKTNGEDFEASHHDAGL
jgi:hypothetical protein